MFSILQISQITKCPFSMHVAQDSHDGRDSARGLRAAPPPARDRERRVGDQADRLRQPLRAPPTFSPFLLPTSSSASCFFASLLLFRLLLTFPFTQVYGDGGQLLCSLFSSFLRVFMLLASGFGADCGLQVQKHQVEHLYCACAAERCSRDC